MSKKKDEEDLVDRQKMPDPDKLRPGSFLGDKKEGDEIVFDPKHRPNLARIKRFTRLNQKRRNSRV